MYVAIVINYYSSCYGHSIAKVECTYLRLVSFNVVSHVRDFEEVLEMIPFLVIVDSPGNETHTSFVPFSRINSTIIKSGVAIGRQIIMCLIIVYCFKSLPTPDPACT